MTLLLLGLLTVSQTPPVPPVEAPVAPMRKAPDASFAAMEKACADADSFAKAVETLAKLDAAYRLPKAATAHFDKLLTLAKSPDEIKLAARLALDLADNFHESFEVFAATGVLDAAMKNAPAEQKVTLQLLRARIGDLNFQSPWIAAKEAWTKLQAEPMNAEAKLAVIRYRCFDQGLWSHGLALARTLPDGADDDFRKVAVKEIAKAYPFQMADTWREWAILQKDERSKKAGLRRARMWYARQMEDSSVAIDGYNRAKKNSVFTLDTVDSECIPGLMEEITIHHRKAVTRSWDVNGFKLYGGAKADLMLETIWTGRLIPPTTGRYIVLLDGTAAAATFKFSLDAKGVPILESGVLPRVLGTFEKAPMQVALVLNGESPVPFEITVKMPATAQAKATLKWIRPGGVAPEIIPAECVYYKP